MKYVRIIIVVKIIVIFLIPIYLSSCTFDNEEELFEDYICDTINVDYDDLTYIFSDICADCHNNVSTYRPGIEMDTYESVKASINTGLVWPAINHTGEYNMPDQRPKLSDCDIKKIEVWIDAGMPEN